MATMYGIVDRLIDRVAEQAVKNAEQAAEIVALNKEITRIQTERRNERQEHEQDFEVLRNELHRLREERDELRDLWLRSAAQNVAARVILRKAADYTDVDIAFELADLAREFFARYPHHPAEAEPAAKAG